MNSTKDELREQILTEFKNVYRLHPADYTVNCTNVVINMIEGFVAERERLASQKAIDYFYWRIDCSTLISELEGWRGCIDMAKHQTEEHLSALQPSNKEGK